MVSPVRNKRKVAAEMFHGSFSSGCLRLAFEMPSMCLGRGTTEFITQMPQIYHRKTLREYHDKVTLTNLCKIAFERRWIKACAWIFYCTFFLKHVCMEKVIKMQKCIKKFGHVKILYFRHAPSLNNFRAGSLRKYVRTVVQTNNFLRKNSKLCKQNWYFFAKNLYIWKICSTFAGFLRCVRWYAHMYGAKTLACTSG